MILCNTEKSVYNTIFNNRNIFIFRDIMRTPIVRSFFAPLVNSKDFCTHRTLVKITNFPEMVQRNTKHNNFDQNLPFGGINFLTPSRQPKIFAHPFVRQHVLQYKKLFNIYMVA